MASETQAEISTTQQNTDDSKNKKIIELESEVLSLEQELK